MRAIEVVEPGAPPFLEPVVAATLQSVMARQPAQATTAPQVSYADWTSIRDILARHRIQPTVLHAIETGHLIVDQRIREELAESRLRCTMLELALVAEAERVSSILESAGIDLRILKGLATGRIDLPHGARHTTDVDGLIPSSKLAPAIRCLGAEGYEPVSENSRYPAAVGKGLVLVSPAGIEIDLHTRLFRFGSPDNLAEHRLFSQPAEIPRTRLLATPQEIRMLHAAGHLWLSPPGVDRRLSSLADYVAIRSATVERGSIQEVAELLDVPSLPTWTDWLADSLLGSPATLPKKPQRLHERAHVRARRSIVRETAALAPRLRTVGDVGKFTRYLFRKQRQRTGGRGDSDRLFGDGGAAR